MRPTIPLASWHIALDLAATRAAHAAIPLPPCGRGCSQCRNWTASHDAVLPEGLRTQLRRLGIVPAEPSELYVSTPNGTRPDYRVTYHCVGRILSGPGAYRDHPTFGRGRWYQPLRPPPDHLTLSVAYEAAVHGGMQRRLGSALPLIQVDFRLTVPWVLDEPCPA